MKVEFSEHDGCFSIELMAETMEEAAKLVRFGMNRKAEVQHCTTNVNSSGSFEAGIVFGKSKRANNDVPLRK